MAESVKPVTTPKFRSAFVYCFKPKDPPAPRPGEGEKKPRYTVLMLYPPGTDLSKLRAAFQEAAKLRWGDKAQATTKIATFKNPFKAGDGIANRDGEPYFPWAEGWTAVETWSYEKPSVVSTERNSVTGEYTKLYDDNDFYAGAWARAQVRAYAYDNRDKNAGFGINFELNHVQKLEDDERLGGRVRTRPEDAFEPIGEPAGAGGDEDWNS